VGQFQLVRNRVQTGLIDYSNRFRRVSNAIPDNTPRIYKLVTLRGAQVQQQLSGPSLFTRNLLNIQHFCACFCYPPPMDHLWTPWRYAYVTGADQKPSCIFCDAPKQTDEQAYIVHRGTYCYIILNAYPYTNGHVMVVPYEHVDELQKLAVAAAREMMSLTQRMETVLRSLYKPDGINLGMNIGKAAGAGVAGHIHMHILPRWVADANFASVIGETRILPESLDVTWERVRKAISQMQMTSA
jgi:ATP adenylyltransferase